MRYEDVEQVLSALARESVEYVLVGGVAIGLHGFERPTRDIDLFIRVDAGNVERLRRALRSIFDDESIDEITVEDLAGAYPTVRYGPPGGEFVIDILGRLGTAFSYDDLEFEERAIAGTVVRLATPRTLFRMKKDTLRPIDQIDAANLRERFELNDD